MPIGTGIIYNVGDLILSQVSGSGTAFLETKIAAATSSIVYFDNTARINSASLNSITVGTASYVSGSTSIITNLTASNISASGTGSFGMVGIGTTSPTARLHVSGSTGGVFEVDTLGGATSFYVSASGNVGIGTPIPTARLDVRPNTPIAAYQGTVPYQTTTAAILSPVMAAASTDTYTSILQLVSVRQALVAGRYAHGYLGFSTVDNSNVNGILDAGRISIKNDEGIGTFSATAMGFWTNPGGSASTAAIERVRIASDGNVGIGTTSATTKLHVSGSVTALDGRFISNVTSGTDKYFLDCYGTSTNQIFALYENSNTAYLNSYSSMAFRANQNGGSGGYFVFSGANVGIGTTSPTNGTLQVYNASGNTLSLQKAAGGAALAMGSDTTNYALIESINAGGIRFYTGNGTQTERLRIDVSGNVGIGTTSPGALLDVSYGDYQNAGTIRIGADIGVSISRTNNTRKYGAITGFPYNNASASIQVIGIDAQGPTITGLTIGGGGTGFASPTQIQFYTTSSILIPGAERMRIAGDGNVGVGTTSPADKLHVIGNIRINGGDILNWGGQAFIQTIGANDMFFRPNSTLRMILTAAGNLGLGNGFTSPAYLLDVSGSSRHGYRAADTHQFTGSVSVSGSLNATASWATNALTASSLVAANSYTITNLTASNISASGTGSFGMVGIGTTLPSAKLHVVGSSILSNNATINPDSYTGIVAGNIADGSGWGVLGIGGNNGNTGRSFGMGVSGTTFYMGFQNGSTTSSLQTFLAVSGSRNLFLVPDGGNVGIGTTSPSYRLQLGSLAGSPTSTPETINLGGTYSNTAGSNIKLRVYDDGSSSGGMSVSNGQMEVNTWATGKIAFYRGTTQSAIIDDNGNVGIGTTIPGALLHVYGATPTIRVQGSSAASAKVDLVGTYTTWSLENQYVNGANNDMFRIYNSALSADAITINRATNNVGIGATNPAYLLDVSGSSRHGYRAVDTHQFTGSVSVSGSLNATASWATNALTASSLVAANSYTITNLTASNIRASATGSFGIVGIGTTIPGAPLDILANDLADGILIRGNDNGNCKIRIVNSGVGGEQFSLTVGYPGASNSSFVIRSVTSSSNRYIIDSSGAHFWSTNAGTALTLNTSGNLGIGTTNPVAKLQVAGNVSGSSFTSSISNAVGFLGTSSFATNATSASYALSASFASNTISSSYSLTSSFATTAQTANALNTGNSYTISGLTVNGNISASGTISASKLRVVGTANVIELAQSSIGSATYYVMDNTVETGGRRYRFGYSGASADLGSFTIYNQTDNITPLTITTSGSVGIGATNPSTPLHVFNTAATLATFTRDLATDVGFSIGADTNGTVFSTAGAHAYQFYTNGTEKVRIISDGNVGIGTTTPAAKLAVEGGSIATVNITGSDVKLSFDIRTLVGGAIGFNNAAASNVYGAVTGSAYFGVAQSYPIVFTTAGAERMRIESGGNVGIGTVSPIANAKLNIVSATDAFTLINATSLTQGNRAALFMSAPNVNGMSGNVSIEAISINNQQNDMVFRTGGNTINAFGTERMRLDTSGNLGIGTTSPGALLEISSSTAASLLNVKGAGGNGLLFVSGSGNVGIGTTVPGAKLDVVGDLRVKSAGAAITLDTSTTSDGRMEYKYNGTRKALIGVDSDNLQIAVDSGNYLQFRTNSTERMRITNDGNVGIGTTSPSTILTIGKPIDASAYGSGSRAIDFKVYFPGYDVNTVKASIYVGVSNQGTLQTTKGYLAFLTSATSGSENLTEKMRIESDGCVGIGTTSPAELLDIAASADNSAIAGPKVNFKKGATTKAVIGIGGNYLGQATQTDDLIFRNDAGNILFGFSGAEKMRINSGGNVGIGTTSPGTKLEVSGSIRGGSFPVLVTNTGEAWFGRGSDRTLGTYTLQLGGSSATGTKFEIVDRAWTKVIASISGEAPVDSFLINSSGNVGIGAGVPACKLQVNGNISGSSFTSSISNAVGFLGTSSWAQNVVSASYALTSSFATTAQTANALNVANTYTIAGLTSAYVDVNGSGTIPTTGIYRPSTKTLGLSADGTLIFKISNVSAPATSSIETGNFIVQTGNVGIGTTSVPTRLTSYVGSGAISGTNDAIRLQVASYNDAARNTIVWAQDSSNIVLARYGTEWNVSTNQMNFVWRDMYNGGAGSTELMRFTGGGNLGIGTTTPAAKLEISGSSNSALMNIKSPISGAILYVSGSGAVGIGTSNVGAYTLQVSGSFAATTKSFVIEHPTKAGKKLIYGSLESPYHGIRLTGRDTLVNGKCKIQLPDYIYKLILHDSVNIQLTGIKCNKTLYVDEINIPENYFTIAYDKAIFESYKDYDFFWDFTGIRADVPELTTEL